MDPAGPGSRSLLSLADPNNIHPWEQAPATSDKLDFRHHNYKEMRKVWLSLRCAKKSFFFADSRQNRYAAEVLRGDAGRLACACPLDGIPMRLEGGAARGQNQGSAHLELSDSSLGF